MDEDLRSVVSQLYFLPKLIKYICMFSSLYLAHHLLAFVNSYLHVMQTQKFSANFEHHIYLNTYLIIQNL